MTRPGVVGVLCLLAMAGCHPEQAALKMFEDQGLHLLRPARSYIEAGGIVIVPKNGRAEYIDRLDPVPPVAAGAPSLAFSAIVLREARQKTAAMGAVLPALQSVLPLSFDATYDHNQKVELGQIQTSGVRLTFPALQSLVQAAGTRTLLDAELKRGSRAFMVWEVHNSTGLSLKATGGSALKVGVGVGGTVAAAPSPGPSAPAVPQAASVPGGPAAGATAAVGDPQISGKWTRTSTYELAFSSTAEIPFAVRLVEVERTGSGLLVLRPGTFKFAGTLGTGTEEERYTALLAQPEITLQRRVE